MWIMWKAVWVYYIRKVQAFQGWLLHNVDYVVMNESFKPAYTLI